MISRSDGRFFHIVLGDRPIEYPAEREAGPSNIMSVGFWYVHDATGVETETVVVILRRPPQEQVKLYRHIKMLPDILAFELERRRRLPSLYEFDRGQFKEVLH